MFTGIVVTVGKVTAKIPSGTALRLIIEAEALCPSLSIGDSVSCEGICLTVEALDDLTFTVCAVAETLARTNAKDWEVGSFLNLEPALKAGTPLGGHFVLGHVDGLARVEGFSPQDGGGGEWILGLPKSLMPYCVSKGSIAVCGVSLTLAGISGNSIRIALIPHTLSNTTLGGKRVGDALNIEVDILAKHVERLLSSWKSHEGKDEGGQSPAPKSDLKWESLAAWGYAPASAPAPADKPPAFQARLA